MIISLGEGDCPRGTFGLFPSYRDMLQLDMIDMLLICLLFMLNNLFQPEMF